MNCGVGGRCGLDPALLWLWYRLAAAALIEPLAWKLLYVAGAAIERNKKKKKKEKESYIMTEDREFHHLKGYYIK